MRIQSGMWWYEVLARVKYLLSFFKQEWTIRDYPVRVRRQADVDLPKGMGQLQAPPWIAQIVNWWVMSGTGDTRSAALDELRQRLEEYRRTQDTMPRPGVRVPLQFASTTEIDGYKVLARDFMDRILGIRILFISDESSLWKYPDTDDAAQVFERIRAAYGVDVSDIEDGNLVRIFERLHAAGHRGREAGHGE